MEHEMQEEDITEYVEIRMKIREHSERIDFAVMNLGRERHLPRSRLAEAP